MSSGRQEEATARGEKLARWGPSGATMALDAATAALVVATAAIAACGESAIRDALRAAHEAAPAEWVEETILQSYLFAGFPRALNAMRLWRSISRREAPARDADADEASRWSARGEVICSQVYGPFYDPLRVNIAALHPALDGWMVTEGYGMVLGRPGLDLKRRELCVMAACAAAQQDRQLHSHLHGSLHVGATPEEVESALELALDTVGSALQPDAPRRYRQLWGKVLGKHAAARSGETRPDTNVSRD